MKIEWSGNEEFSFGFYLIIYGIYGIGRSKGKGGGDCIQDQLESSF